MVSTAIALLAAAGTVVLLSDEREPRRDEGPEGSDGPTVTLVPAEDVPSFEQAVFTTFDGEDVPLRTLRGRPTVVNFFASYCTPCITEMPAFEDVYADIGPRGEVAFLGLAVSDRTEDAEQLVADTGVTYPTAEDKDGSVIAALEGVVLPTTVLLDAEGEVVARRSGALSADDLRRLLEDELGLDL